MVLLCRPGQRACTSQLIVALLSLFLVVIGTMDINKGHSCSRTTDLGMADGDSTMASGGSAGYLAQHGPNGRVAFEYRYSPRCGLSRNPLLIVVSVVPEAFTQQIV